MAVNILFAATENRWSEYELPLNRAMVAVGIEAHIATEVPTDEVDYIVYAPSSDVQDFTPFTRAKAVLNLWAGVEAIIDNPTLKIPLCRMVDPAMTQGMVEWVTGHVLRHHLGMDAHITADPGTWEPVAPPVAWDRRVTVFGLGVLGSACAAAMAGLGFNVAGWARSEKTVPGVQCFFGADGFKAALARTDIAVLLLPDTPATTNMFDATAFAQMPSGAFIVNPGRGPLVDDDALIHALDSGHLNHATLDVFRVEPLPTDHAFWRHPKVTVTPHIASETRAKSASETIAENVRRGEAGEPFVHVVNRERGY